MLSWAGVCLDKPTGFITEKNGKRIHIRMHVRTHTYISGSDCGNQAVTTSPSVRTRGMRTDKRKKEKEIKQQKTCPFSAAAIL